jgi:ribose transport system substrate-binding protein
VQGKEIPSASFVKHQMITPHNVDHMYPNDRLIAMGKDDSLLFSKH